MPVLTSVDLANRSLDLVGTNTIGTLNDTTKEAMICRRNYDQIRREVLRMHPWNFALTRATINLGNSQAPVAPAFEFTYSFFYPQDALRLTNITDSDGIDSNDFKDWALEGRFIFSSTDTLWIRYVKDFIDVDDFDPVFFNCFALKLAWMISYKLTQSTTLKDQLWKDYLAAERRAKFLDSVENPGFEIDSDVWMRSRLGPSQGFVRDPQT